MLFKNLQLYRLTKPLSQSPEELAAKLAEYGFRPCGSLEMSSYGWCPPLGGEAEDWVHAAAGYKLLCARKEEKILPAAVVREVVGAKAAEIAEEQARKVGRKERERLRDEVLQDLLPRAFTRSVHTYAYIDKHGDWLVVDAASANRAEELLNLLRESLGTLPVAAPAVAESPAAVMTRWLTGADARGDFQLGDECELKDPQDDGGIIRCKRQDLGADEIQAHAQAGKYAVKLALDWRERLSFLLTDDLAVKRLRFSDVVEEDYGGIDAPDAAGRFDAQFTMMALELDGFLGALLEAFGGEDTAAYG